MARSSISLGAIPSALNKLNRRLTELNEVGTPEFKDDISHMSKLIADKVNATLDDVFGQNTVDADEFWIQYSWFQAMTTNWEERKKGFVRGRERAIACVRGAIQRLEEKLADADEDASGRALRAYEGLELHSEIARAASDLYRNGHYANAVEASVKALNALVRLRSGLEIDGAFLMEHTFSPNKPILQFNDLSDKSDHDEQKGFMMMFSGAVSGLRNPRAHGFIHDDPERALEFIAFVSLLAKLLDEAKRT
jgi:uncharacterized protein (TIGR02391 family)